LGLIVPSSFPPYDQTHRHHPSSNGKTNIFVQ
jgi:hypothetical protein